MLFEGKHLHLLEHCFVFEVSESAVNAWGVLFSAAGLIGNFWIQNFRSLEDAPTAYFTIRIDRRHLYSESILNKSKMRMSVFFTMTPLHILILLHNACAKLRVTKRQASRNILHWNTGEGFVYNVKHSLYF